MSDLEITMLIQKFAEENDLYSKEVRNLLSEGGVERLISQYKNISRRLDNISDENKALKRHIADLESKLEMHESECDPRNHSKELHYFAIAQNQFFRKENERLKNKNKILYDYIHGITGNTEDEIDKNIKSLESNENHVDIKATATPMDISTHLINNTCTINELEQIAEHLLVYCKHNKESE